MGRHIHLPTFSPAGREICRRALEKYGPESRIAKTAEESAEYSAALNRIRSNPAKGWDQAAEELADVLITTQQLSYMRPGFFAAVSHHMQRKLKRLDANMTEFPCEIETKFIDTLESDLGGPQ